MFEFFVRHSDVAQILIFAAAISSLWVVEHVALAQPQGQKLRHMGINALFVLTALPAELLLSAACLWTSVWVAEHHWGLLNLIADPSNLWVRYALAFVALDLCDYGYHRVAHHVPVVWRFHLVHHTDQMVDSSTTVREHPGETAVRGAFLVLWTFLLGASFEVLLLRQAAETVFAILAHSALRLPKSVDRLAGLVFITPNLHHVHHHFELPYTNRNYGGVFSVWDRLFGTFAELSPDQTIFGLDTHMDPLGTQRPTRLFAMPFETH
jgi:sterol desaturase/sphingolipid hydroxylase (fatty acid hydroxylase superfamily)